MALPTRFRSRNSFSYSCKRYSGTFPFINFWIPPFAVAPFIMPGNGYGAMG
jgi:hypothetical protein